MKDLNDHRGWRDKCYKVETTRRKWGRGTVISAICNKHGYHSGGVCPKCEMEEKIETPHIQNWNPEWSYLSTGMRMGKKELKEYCKRNGKEWVNA